MAETSEIRLINLFPAIFARNATKINPMAITGTSIGSLSVSKSFSAYVLNVRATRLSLMIIENAMRRAALPVTVVAP